MNWKRIRLTLARSREHPDGSNRHGYEIVLPLKPDGTLDQTTLDRTPELCSVHRFWEGEGDALGRLKRERGGNWVIVYDPGGPAEEPIHHFARHRLVAGEYLSTHDHNGTEHVFRVVSVRPEPGLGGGKS
jgi:hypothetical protein